jgi:type I restriction enzyme, S subunit
MARGPIKDFALGIFDGPHATPPDSETGPVYLGIKNVTKDGRLDLSDARYLSEDDYARWTRRVAPQPDDIVFSYEATLHLYALIPSGFRGCLGRRMALVRPDKSKVVPRFLHYYFLSSAWRATVEANIVSGATVDRIPIIKFPDFEVDLPDIDKQQKIAAILSAYDDMIENNRRRIHLLEEAARLIYREWFVRLRFPGHEHVPVHDGVPEGWEDRAIGEIAETIGGGTPSTKNPEYWDAGDITWFVPSDLTSNDSLVMLESERCITASGLRSSSAKLLPPNTILMTSRASIGYFGLYDGEAATNQGFISVIPHDDIYRLYVLFNLMSRKDEIEARAGGTTFKEINKTTFRNMRIILPSFELASRFDALASPMISQIRVLKKQNKSLTRARDLLLPRLMSGEITV